MLEPEEKEQILTEELFRQETRKFLTEKFEKKNTVFEFLNSPFGIWLFSTIVVGLFVFSYNSFNEHRKEVTDRDVRIRQLDTEIKTRLEQFWVNIDTLTKSNQSGEKDSISLTVEEVDRDKFRVVWDILKESPAQYPKASINIYKEFASRPIASLIYEEIDLLKNKYGLDDFENIKAPEKLPKLEQDERSELFRLEHAAEFIQGDWIFHVPKRTLWEIWQRFQGNLLDGRWHITFRY